MTPAEAVPVFAAWIGLLMTVWVVYFGAHLLLKVLHNVVGGR